MKINFIKLPFPKLRAKLTLVKDGISDKLRLEDGYLAIRSMPIFFKVLFVAQLLAAFILFSSSSHLWLLASQMKSWPLTANISHSSFFILEISFFVLWSTFIVASGLLPSKKSKEDYHVD